MCLYLSASTLHRIPKIEVHQITTAQDMERAFTVRTAGTVVFCSVVCVAEVEGKDPLPVQEVPRTTANAKRQRADRFICSSFQSASLNRPVMDCASDVLERGTRLELATFCLECRLGNALCSTSGDQGKKCALI